MAFANDRVWNFLTNLLNNVDGDVFCMTGLTGGVRPETGKPTLMKDALSVPDADERPQVMEGEFHGL